MVDFAQLLQLDLSALESFADRWRTIRKHLEETSNRFEDSVLKPLEREDWKGEAADAAEQRCSEIHREIGALVEQAGSVRAYIDETVSGSSDIPSLRKFQEEATELQHEAIAKGLSVDDRGEVSWVVMRDPGELTDEERKEDQRKQQEADDLERRIKDLVSRASEADEYMAKALKVIFGTVHNFDTENRVHGSDSDEFGLRDILADQKLEFVHDYMEGTKGWEDAAGLLRHWLDGGGNPYEVDPQEMLKEIPAFREDVSNTLNSVRDRIDGEFSTEWHRSSPDVEEGDSSVNWYYALNNFQYRVVGNKEDGEITYRVEVQKQYNWGTPSEHRSDLHRLFVHLEQADIAHLHSVGVARDFEVYGSSEEKKVSS